MGESIKDFDQIKQQATRHFSKLYTSEGNIDEDISNSLLSNIPIKISEDDNLKLNQQIEEEEIEKAINQFHQNKAPGPDAFTPLL